MNLDAEVEAGDAAPSELIESIRRGLADAAAGRVMDGRVVVESLRQHAKDLRAKLERNGDSVDRGGSAA